MLQQNKCFLQHVFYFILDVWTALVSEICSSLDLTSCIY